MIAGDQGFASSFPGGRSESRLPGISPGGGLWLAVAGWAGSPGEPEAAGTLFSKHDAASAPTKVQSKVEQARARGHDPRFARRLLPPEGDETVDMPALAMICLRTEDAGADATTRGEGPR
jgi:hypothetical protein